MAETVQGASEESLVATSWVGGRPLNGGTHRQLTDPASGDAVAEVLDARDDDVTAAGKSAAEALASVASASTATRAGWLRELAGAIDHDSERLARLETLSVGKTLVESRAGAGAAATTLGYYAELLEDGVLEPRRSRSRLGGELEIQRLPIGVVGHILPWNFPLPMAAARIAMSIAAGCSCLLKPSELAPLTPSELGRLTAETSLPPGAVNVIVGGADCGAALTRSPDVAAVCFTGGSERGPDIIHATAEGLKPVTLELGGRSANVVLPDADLDLAVEGTVRGAYLNAGQSCSASVRVLVHAELAESFSDKLATRVANIRVGPGLSEDSDMGPLISARARDRFGALVGDAVSQGSACLVGGEQPRDQALSRGHFFLPTVLRDLVHSSRLAREEAFGPVAVIDTFRDEEDVAAQINASDRRLAAGIWGGAEAAARVARRLRVGVVWVNTYHEIAPDAPWGGFGASGFGRVLGSDGLLEFTSPRQIYARGDRST